MKITFIEFSKLLTKTGYAWNIPDDHLVTLNGYHVREISEDNDDANLLWLNFGDREPDEIENNSAYDWKLLKVIDVTTQLLGA